MSLKIGEIKKIFENTAVEELPDKIDLFRNDERSGVIKLVAQYDKKYSAHLRELNRLEEISVYEKELRQQGYSLIGGIDEVGRGPLAGPVVTAVVI
ncbi:MAG: ribonuclease HII, partial [Clostridia bacterium]|nr:ribonuclease HII [Clostridia bacterium]